MDEEAYNEMKKEIYNQQFIYNLINNIDNMPILSELSKKYRVGDATLLEYIEYFKKSKNIFHYNNIL